MGPAALAALLSIQSGRKFQEFIEDEIVREPDPDLEPYQPPATLFLPVRGADHDLAANLRSLAEQDYPDYELIVVCRDANDPAVSTAQLTLGRDFHLVVAGPPPDDTGEKVHNLLAAVRQARPESEAFAFADSDGQVAGDWLRNLIQPLSEAGVGATTGFRWHFPENGGFWPLLRSAWDATIAGSMRPDGKNFAWGGAMAIRREIFQSARVTDYWKGTVSDDCRLSQAMDDAGLLVRFAPKAMAATTGDCSRDEFLHWTTRQLTITKVYRAKLWTAGLVAHIVYCGAMAAGVVACLLGEPIGLGALVVTQLPGMAKGAMRGYTGRLMFPQREEWFDSHGGSYFWMTPIATWVWLYAFLTSAATRTIRWRGYVYELPASDRTRLLKGPPATS